MNREELLQQLMVAEDVSNIRVVENDESEIGESEEKVDETAESTQKDFRASDE